MQSNECELIGDYAKETVLGQGAFGTVFIGKHLLTGCPVAIKILEKGRIKDNKDLNLIKRELHILKMV